MPLEFLITGLTSDDSDILLTASGLCEGQLVWEALVLLVALRVWKPRWHQRRVSLTVTGDNIGMLTLLLKMRPPTGSTALGIISREMGLDLADGVYAPDVIQHVPGISNVQADLLSRRFDPSYAERWSLPPSLANVTQANVPKRDRAFYRSLQ